MAELIPYLAIFGAGVAGSVHCIGMCGGFAVLLGAQARSRNALVRRQLLYNLGRVTSYVFIGALAGLAGATVLSDADGWGGGAQRLLAVVSGALLVMVALQFFGYRVGLWREGAAPLAGAFAATLRSVARAPGPAAPLALGVLNGFLPCPLVYAFAVQAAATAAPLPGMAVMAAFGLGTFPAMLLMGFGGAFAGPRMRQAWVAGTIFLVLGVITLGRAMLPIAGHEVHL